LHALFMWLNWNVLGFLLVGSVRWWASRKTILLHVGCGLSITCFSIWLSIRACVYLKEARIEWNLHAILGILMTVFILFPVISGSFVIYKRRYEKWGEEKWLVLRNYHK